MSHRPWDDNDARALVQPYVNFDGALLPMLHALQAEFGYIDDSAVAMLADVLNISRAEVVGVIHFYHDFEHEPPARHTLQVCRAEACQSMGCESLLEHIAGYLGSAVGGRTADGEVALKAVYCLGNCALSPAVMLDGRLYGRVTNHRAEAILASARQGS